VNGRPVSTVALADGDELSLAGLEAYRVTLEPEPEPAVSEAPRRPPDRSDPNATRYEWGAEERQALAELRRTLGRLGGGGG
jgi:hypothetical protein